MPELTAEQAIDALKGLPEDRQRAILAKLSPDVKQGIMEKLQSPQKQPWLSSPDLTTRSEHDYKSLLPGKNGQYNAGAYAREAARSLSDIGAAGIDFLEHPQRLVASAVMQSPPVQAYTDVSEAIRKLRTGEPTSAEQQGQDILHHPLENVEALVGQAGAMAAATGVLGPVTRGLADKVAQARSKMVEGVTDTGPRTTRDFVKTIQDKNETEIAKTAEKNATEEEKAKQANATQDTKRAQQVRGFHEKTRAASEAGEAAQNVADRKVALEHGVEQLDPEIKTELEKTEEKVNQEANKRYNDLAPALKNIQADPDILRGVIADGAESITGTESDPTILKDMEKRLSRGDQFTYEDLQGYRAELGRELRKGTLPGDVFHAYKMLHKGVTDEMESIAGREDARIAQETGQQLPKEQTYLGRLQAARDYYRQYAEAFIDRTSPIRKALDSTERGHAVKAFGGKDQSGVEALAKYNPELARRINTVRGYVSEARNIRPSTAKPKEPSPLPPKPEPIQPKVTEPKLSKIDADDIREAKAGNLQKRAELIRRYSARAAFYVTGYRSLVAIGRAVMGDPAALESLPVDIGEGITVAAGGGMFANFLESPKVVKLLTEPTERDLAQIPPELRGDLKPLIQQAQKQGIKVDPTLAALVGAVALPKGRVTQQLEKAVSNARNSQSSQ